MFKKILILLIIFSSISGASAWYDPNWGYRIPVSIDNTGNVSLTAHRFDVSIPSGINESSIRVVNDSSGLVVAHWAENVSLGVCYGLWFNGSVDSGVSENYYIYYGNDNVSSTSSYNDTFGDGIVLDTPLTSRYADGNTMIDRSPSGNNGTNHGATVGSDYSEFDGVDDKIVSVNPLGFNIHGGDYTAGVMMYINKDVKVNWPVCLKIGSTYGNGFAIEEQRFITHDGAVVIVSYTGLSVREWHSIIVTHNISEKKICVWIDGNLYNDKVYSGILPNTQSGYVTVGDTSFGSWFNGSISDTRIYNRALTPTQITSLYEQGNTTPSVTLQSVEGLLPPPSIFQNTVTTLAGFPTAVSSILSSFLQYLPLFVGILISGFLIIICVGVFGKLKRW